MIRASGELEPVWRDISAHISECTNAAFACRNVRALSGGCINSAFLVDGGNTRYFVKLNAARRRPMFEAEAEGLRELAGANALRVPQPLCFGGNDEHAWLVLEYLGELGSAATGSDWSQLGRGLARLHRSRRESYGWRRDNTIGSTKQKNLWSGNWVDFLRVHRLGYQLDLAVRNGYGARLESSGRRLLDKLEFFFGDYAPEASLLHGDLWSGNVGFLASGEPVVFDPAVYYGDRETDIAMTELFGGFAAEFYRAYATEWPLHQGFRLRKPLYNLYHLLNHLNLFGHGYLASCEATIAELLASAR